jgi:hypothetical protein
MMKLGHMKAEHRPGYELCLDAPKFKTKVRAAFE